MGSYMSPRRGRQYVPLSVGSAHAALTSDLVMALLCRRIDSLTSDLPPAPASFCALRRVAEHTACSTTHLRLAGALKCASPKWGIFWRGSHTQNSGVNVLDTQSRGASPRATPRMLTLSGAFLLTCMISGYRGSR